MVASILRFAALSVATACCAPLFGAIVYNESVNGDLSNIGSTPTAIAVGIGSNQIVGSTGRGSDNVLDRDYFTFVVPMGALLTSVFEVAGTVSAGNFAFIGLQAGSVVSVDPTGGTAAGLLGWTHYLTVNATTDVLPLMNTTANGASGFVTPLGPGAYSVWIQELSGGSYPYAFDITLTAVPEPGTCWTAAAFFAAMAALKRRPARSA
jgi:hypothetical protein